MAVCIPILRVAVFSESYVILNSKKDDVVKVDSSWPEARKVMLSDLIREI